MTLDNPSSIYNLLISSAAKGIKYDLASSISSHKSGVPHLFTLSLKYGTKPPVSISPIHVWFDAGTIKISSFVCLVGLGLGISSYIIYKIYKQAFPIRANSLSSIVNNNNNNNNQKATKADKIKVTESSSVGDNSSHDADARLEANRKHLQNPERHPRRRKVARAKQATPSTDSDADHGLEAASLYFGGTSDKTCRRSGLGNDPGFKDDHLQTRSTTFIVTNPANKEFNFLDDHQGNRFVVTPVEPETANERPSSRHCLRCDSVIARRCTQSTPYDFGVDGDILDLGELNSESGTRGTSQRGSKASFSGSDSDRTGVSLSQPSSEMFETAKDIVLSGTLNEMEQLQSQLDLLYNDVDDLNYEMESLQKREDPKETVARRYTLGAEEALTARKNKSKESNQKKAIKNRSRFLRRLDLQNPSTTDNRTRSCDLLGSDRSEDGVAALVETADGTWNHGSEFRGSFVSNVCSELERLSSDGSIGEGLVKLSDTSCSSISCEQVLEECSESSPGNCYNKTFVIKSKDSETIGANGSMSSKTKKTKLDATDDLYIDDDIISHSSDNVKRGNEKLSFLAKGTMSPVQFVIRPRSLTSFSEQNSIYKTPERSLAANFASPWMSEGNEDTNYVDYLASRDDRLNLVNNNINLNLISELLFLSSRDGPLSPQTSNFLATCMDSPDRASANLDVATIRKFMEKIGEAVVGFGSSGAPLKKCTGRAISTPVNPSNHTKAFLSTVKKLCSSFPLWVVSNLEEPVEITEYAGKKFCANTESHIYQGYEHISQLIGARNICSVRRDNFCSIRATLCQAIVSNKLGAFSHEFVDNHNKYLQVFEATGNDYLKGTCFSNRLPFNKGSEMEVVRSCFDLLLNVMTSQEAIHSKVHDPTQREEQLKSLLDALFNGCPIIDLHLMEAIKMVMMVEVIELYKAFGANPTRSKPLAWAIFSGKSGRNPEQFFRRRMHVIGDTQPLNKVELSLLAYSLKIKLEVLRPALFLGHSSEAFVSHYPDEGADDCEKVTLVEEADDAFLLVLQ